MSNDGIEQQQQELSAVDRVQQLYEREEAEWLWTISGLQEKYDSQKMLTDFVESRNEYLLTQLKELEGGGKSGNAKLMQLGQMLQQFYQAGEHKSLWTVWLAITPEKQRKELTKLIATLRVVEIMVAEEYDKLQQKTGTKKSR